MIWIAYGDAKLQVNRNNIGKSQKSFDLLKNIIFKVHGIQKLSTKKVDSLSFNYLGN